MTNHDDETLAPGPPPTEPSAIDATVPVGTDRRGIRPAGIGELESLAPVADDGAYLAHFRIYEMVGRGGMGTVYRALDTLLDRQVAVKVLSERLGRSPDFQNRFIAEAKILARMNHPNIPQIHFIGKAGGRFFFAMEWIEGSTVQEIVAGGRLSELKALGIVMQAAEALQAAHRAGIVHRDIKPSNLMVTPDEVVKVLDFGLARSAANLDDSATGGFEGTPHYASPEQIRGTAVDARSDVYSLGLTLHHLLAGRPPRAAREVASALDGRHVAPLPELPGDVDCSAGTREVLARMLAAEPAERFPNGGELLDAVRAAYPAPPTAAAATTRALAFMTDLLLMALPVFAVFTAFWKAKGYFVTTLLYDSPAGRIALSTGLFAWLAVYPFLAGSHSGRTIGQLLQGIRVSRRDGESPSRREVAARTAIVWGPACVAMGLQPEWPPASIGDPTASSAALANLCWLWSALWVMLLGVPLLGRNRLSLVDWLSRTRVVVPRSGPARSATATADRHGRHLLPSGFIQSPRVLAGFGAVLIWLVTAVLAGGEIRSALSQDRWRVFVRHSMFESVREGDPGWNRLADRFLAGFLLPHQSTPDPTVLSIERHPFLPGIYARPHPDLVVEDEIIGTRSHHYAKALQGSAGGKHYLNGGTRNRQTMEPADNGQALRWQFARRERYHGSFAHFLRALAHGRLAREGFEVLTPEAFGGLFRTGSGDDFILVAWPELRVRVPGTLEPQVLRLYHGSLRVSTDGTNLSGSWGGFWRGGGLPDTILAMFAAEKDSAWSVAIDEVQRVVTLE
jgi:tRNA A-37 threonylcarbamoyl transferase component Bud32/uncharacterized RDD family membrane protein YckC